MSLGSRRFPFKLVALDLDGTLLAPDKSISRENRAAVRRLVDAGIQVVLASGRPHHNMIPYHLELGLTGPIVSGNGGVVRDTASGETWKETLLDHAFAREVLAEGKRVGITQIWDGPEGVFAVQVSAWSEVLAERTRSKVVAQPVPEAGQPYKLLWIDAEAVIVTHEETYRTRWGHKSYVVCTDPEYLEFCPPGTNKAAGLAVVCERLCIAPAEVLAIGDGDNDAEMLAWAGLGIAPAHARAKALAAADRVAPPGPEETAVARALSAIE
jgi:Cof subfamily protein (haloacid dehalogenase superfamily)